jgi:hypothetical protein
MPLSKGRSKCRTYTEIRNSPDTIAASLAIQQLIREHHIDELELRRRVRFFRHGEFAGSQQRWSDRFKMKRPKARSFAWGLREVARTLEEAQTLQFTLAIRGPLTVDQICEALNSVAVEIERSLKETNDRKVDWTVAPKRELTQFVWRKTGKPLDRLLADLIGAILRTPGYSAEDQRKFRGRHCRLEGTDTYLLPPGPDTIPPIND